MTVFYTEKRVLSVGRILGGANETEDAVSVCCIKELGLGKV